MHTTYLQSSGRIDLVYAVVCYKIANTAELGTRSSRVAFNSSNATPREHRHRTVVGTVPLESELQTSTRCPAVYIRPVLPLKKSEENTPLEKLCRCSNSSTAVALLFVGVSLLVYSTRSAPPVLGGLPLSQCEIQEACSHQFNSIVQ